MNLKRKLMSVLSVVLALCVLLSIASFALDRNDSSDTEDFSSSVGAPFSSQEPDGDTSQAANSEDTPAEVPSVTSGWTQFNVGGTAQFAFGYINARGETVYAGEDLTSSEYQVFYLPEQTYSENGVSKTFVAGYYFFSDSYWDQSYTNKEPKRYSSIIEIKLNSSTNLYEISKTNPYFMMTVSEGIGTRYSGLHKDSDGIKRRYDDGSGRGGEEGVYALGTDGSLFFYIDGEYLSDTCRTKITGYNWFDGKLYYGNSKSKNVIKYCKASLFTDRYAGLRYKHGVLYTGYALGYGRESRNLYYYYNGNYRTDLSKKKLQGYVKFNGKLYYGNTKSLNHYKTSPKAFPFTGYRMTHSKLYKYTKGVASRYTGVYKKVYYEKGVKKAKRGWLTVGGHTYYFKSGKALTSWHYLKRNHKTYKYYFDSNGILSEDLFSTFGKSYLRKPMIIKINRNTHTADILLYDSKKRTYCIAAKSFVCSTCEKSSDFKVGTYRLYNYTYIHSKKRSWRRRWFKFTHPKTRTTSYYQYASFILGTDSWIHSSSYYKKNIRTLKVGNYNKLGTNQSFYCVRFQVGNSKIVYDAVGKQGKGKVKAVLYRSNNKGPYGKINLSDTTGKLSSRQKYDPTDPAI